MDWLVRFPWPESLKKKVCIYLLQRYLGHFIEEKLTIDQLTLDLYNGRGTVSNVTLDVQALNDLGEQQHLPLEFVDGFVSEVLVSIPWSALMTESGYVQVTGLRLTAQPRPGTNCGTSMFESMWSSMTSSMQLAQECLEQDAGNAVFGNPLEGLESIAQAIDSVLCRIKVRFIDTVIRLEHVPLDSTTGVAIELSIKNLEYSDEAGNDQNNVSMESNQPTKGYVVSAFSTKRLYFEGVSLHTDEFPSRSRTYARNIPTSRDSSPESKNSDSQFHTAQLSPSQLTQSLDKSITNTNSCLNPIMFAKFTGRQELRFKRKQGEGVLGPKVEMELTLGSFISFLSPRQVRLLVELGHGLASPDLQDMSNVAPRACTEKPMAGSDFNRVERELMQQLHPTQDLRSTDLGNAQGWSSAPGDESDNEEQFLPMDLGINGMSDSISTNNNISMEGSISGSSVSSKGSTTNYPKHHKHRPSAETDPTAETSQFHVRVSSITFVLLHEDILTVSIEGRHLTSASTEQMKLAAEEFFQKLGLFAADGYGNRNIDKVSKVFADACRYSHIRLLAAPLVLEGSEKTTTQASATTVTVNLATLEIVECLVDTSNGAEDSTIEFIELLGFPKDTSECHGYLNSTDFRMRLKHTENAVRRGQMTKMAHPRTEIEIRLEGCRSEFDITIVDRISAVLNPEPICCCNTSFASRDTNQLFYQAVESPSLSDSRVDVRISSPRAVVKVRFPVPDLRPLHDMSRAPWWTRSVRSDFITLTLNELRIHSTIDSRAHHLARHEIECRRLLLTYTEGDSDSPVEIAMAQADEKAFASLPQEGGFCLPRMTISIFPSNVGGPLEDSSEGDPDSSLDDTLERPPKHQPSPFSSKRVIHESDTPHSDAHTSPAKDDTEHREGEELVIPGNRQEMQEFIDEGTGKVQVDISLPCLSVQIPSKHLYELLYNRINTDLFLWEPSAPRPKYMCQPDHNLGLDLASTILQEEIHPSKFSMCKSGIQYDSDSNSNDDEIYESTQERLPRPKTGQSKMALTLTIGQGLLSMYTPVRDVSSNVIPGQQGELILRVEDATIFIVNVYKGDPNLGYVCAMVRTVSLNHCGLTTTPSHPPPLRPINSVIPRHTQAAIYRTDPTNIMGNPTEKDMLAVAVRIQSAHQTHRIKTFRVAVGIRNATLRHRMCSSQTSWFTQLMDGLDVADHPVAGYNPPGVLTELHLHLWECAVDYRPVYLPLRSMLTFGCFSVSSNIAARTNTSTLRFIAEDLAFFISDKLGNHVDLRRDYVCVMDLGLFELSLRLNEKMCGGAPRVDLRASNNVLHVRTCADSGQALMQLLTYFASDGDLGTNSASTESIAVPSSGDEESLLGDDSINSLSKSQVERVNSLMEEAMADTVKGTTVKSGEKSPESDTQVEEFLFPDESHSAAQNIPEMSNNSNASSVPIRGNDIDDADEDFCILGEEAGAGIMPRHGVPEVRWLCQESLRVVDNHFAVPIGKTDLLKAPRHFPNANVRYTLCEMTLIWHMFGGRDFGNSKVCSKKHVTIDESSHRGEGLHQGRSRSAIPGVGFTTLSPDEVRFGSAPNSPCPKVKEPPKDWYTLGGPNRQQNVLMELQLNKVRFQHESYPETTTEASRQVLLIGEIEIRDRLASSHINKFLYQYTCEAKPRQTHANMFSMKAVHVRPDPKLSAQECCLKLSLLPLRLNIDQDSLLFLISFFTELAGTPKTNQDGTNGPSNVQSTPGSKQGTPTHHPPVMSVNDESEDMEDAAAHMDNIDNKEAELNLLILLEDELTIRENKTKHKISNGQQDDSQPIYFRSVIFAPEVLVRLDYHGKRVDLTHGSLAGVLMGLAQLNCSELRLKRLAYRHGLLGFDKLMSFLFAEWLQDIKKNQLQSLLGGVGPMYSVVQLVQGIRDLFWMPIEQYQKDGRIVRGIQRGANSFSTSTAMAALELTSRLVHAIQSTAETAYDMVSPGPSVRRKAKGQKGRRKHYNQPIDIREGMTNAYMLVKEGLGETATQLVRVASEEHEQKGVSGAVGGVLRQIPPTVVKPIILATEATSNVLGGMRSQLVPDARREAAQKWRTDSRE